MIPFVSNELQKIYSKLLKMIVQGSAVEEASGPRSLLAIEINKDTLLPILSIKMPTSSLSTPNAWKPDGLQKKNLLKDCSYVIQSILKGLKENAPLNFNLVKKYRLAGSFEYYPEEKHICFQVWKAGNKLIWV